MPIWLIATIGALLIIAAIFIPIIAFCKYNKRAKNICKPLDMYLDGWCENCDANFADCMKEGKCLGERDERHN